MNQQILLSRTKFLEGVIMKSLNSAFKSQFQGSPGSTMYNAVGMQQNSSSSGLELRSQVQIETQNSLISPEIHIKGIIHGVTKCSKTFVFNAAATVYADMQFSATLQIKPVANKTSLVIVFSGFNFGSQQNRITKNTGANLRPGIVAVAIGQSGIYMNRIQNELNSQFTSSFDKGIQVPMNLFSIKSKAYQLQPVSFENNGDFKVELITR